jgi:hypothetical protein
MDSVFFLECGDSMVPAMDCLVGTTKTFCLDSLAAAGQKAIATLSEWQSITAGMGQNIVLFLSE